MMQKKKAIAELIFLVIGSVLAIVLCVILISNFLSDGRSSVKKDEIKNKQAFQPYKPDVVESQSSNFQTLKYQRDNLDEEKSKDKSTAEKDSKEKRSQKLKVEIINYTNVPKLAERYKKVLESEGFSAVAINLTSSKSHETTIIERNARVDGQGVFEVIKVGRIKQVLKKNYPYDVTLVLGDDINP